jgi:chorismate mutase
MSDEFSIKEVIMEIRDTVSKMDDKLSKHISESIEVNKDVASLRNDVADHHTVLYNPTTGLIYRVKSIEEYVEAQRKVMWEIAKPGLGMLGALLLIGLGMLAILAYGLQVILQSLAP